MCVLALAWKADPRWLLVAVANRDERHDRPAEALHRWAEQDILAGRDISAGGSWLAVSERGGFAAVTNRHGYGLPDPGRASRGALVVDLASGALPAIDRLSDYNPFNAVSVTHDHAYFLTNRATDDIHPLTPGLYGISNGPLDPPWVKSQRLTAGLRDWLEQGDVLPEALLAILTDQHAATDTAGDPGPIFVADPVYGTRCSSVVVVNQHGRGQFIERRFDNHGRITGDTKLQFEWPISK